MALAAKTESNAYDKNYLAPENLALGALQTSTSKISDTSALSAVSWAVIFAGAAAAAAALALILLLLGTGLGSFAVSPWADNANWTSQDIKAISFDLTAILCLTFTQVVTYCRGVFAVSWTATWSGCNRDAETC